MLRTVSAISFSSSCAGTTTATRLPSSTLRNLGRAADDPECRLPKEGGDDAQDQPDQSGDQNGVAAAARGGLRRDRAGRDLRRLDLLRECELLLVRPQPVDRGPAL